MDIDEDSDDEEFMGKDELDDESTLIQADQEEAEGEKEGEELETLREEGEMSIEQLRAMYANMGDAGDSDSDSNSNNDISDEEQLVDQGNKSCRSDEKFVGEVELDDESTLIQAEQEEGEKEGEEEEEELKIFGSASQVILNKRGDDGDTPTIHDSSAAIQMIFAKQSTLWRVQ
jgi:hypothetical protein